jgi:hypothetical protein
MHDQDSRLQNYLLSFRLHGRMGFREYRGVSGVSGPRYDADGATPSQPFLANRDSNG